MKRTELSKEMRRRRSPKVKWVRRHVIRNPNLDRCFKSKGEEKRRRVLRRGEGGEERRCRRCNRGREGRVKEQITMKMGETTEDRRK